MTTKIYETNNVHYGTPPYQKAGHLLLEYALLKMQRIGVENVFLWVLEQNQHARRFYERHGFSFEGERGQLVIEGVPLTELRYLRALPLA